MAPWPKRKSEIVFVCYKSDVKEFFKGTHPHGVVAEVQDVYDGRDCNGRVVGERDLSGTGAGEGTPFAEMRREHGSEDRGGDGEYLRGYNEGSGLSDEEDNVAISVDVCHGCELGGKKFWVDRVSNFELLLF